MERSRTEDSNIIYVHAYIVLPIWPEFLAKSGHPILKVHNLSAALRIEYRVGNAYNFILCQILDSICCTNMQSVALRCLFNLTKAE